MLKVVLAGLDNAGKTTIYRKTLEHVNPALLANVAPTKGVERRTYDFVGEKVVFWDLGGQLSYRMKYRREPKLLRGTFALVFVVDLQAPDRFYEAFDYFQDLLELLRGQDAHPIVFVFFHKLDPQLTNDLKPHFHQAVLLFNEIAKQLGDRFKSFATSIFSPSADQALKRVLWEIFPDQPETMVTPKSDTSTVSGHSSPGAATTIDMGTTATGFPVPISPRSPASERTERFMPVTRFKTGTEKSSEDLEWSSIARSGRERGLRDPDDTSLLTTADAVEEPEVYVDAPSSRRSADMPPRVPRPKIGADTVTVSTPSSQVPSPASAETLPKSTGISAGSTGSKLASEVDELRSALTKIVGTDPRFSASFDVDSAAKQEDEERLQRTIEEARQEAQQELYRSRPIKQEAETSEEPADIDTDIHSQIAERIKDFVPQDAVGPSPMPTPEQDTTEGLSEVSEASSPAAEPVPISSPPSSSVPVPTDETTIITERPTVVETEPAEVHAVVRESFPEGLPRVGVGAQVMFRDTDSGEQRQEETQIAIKRQSITQRLGSMIEDQMNRSSEIFAVGLFHRSLELMTGAVKEDLVNYDVFKVLVDVLQRFDIATYWSEIKELREGGLGHLDLGDFEIHMATVTDEHFLAIFCSSTDHLVMDIGSILITATKQVLDVVPQVDATKSRAQQRRSVADDLRARLQKLKEMRGL